MKILDSYEGYSLVTCSDMHDVQSLSTRSMSHLPEVLIRMGSTEEAEWIVDKLDGHIPYTLETPIDVTFMPASGAPLRRTARSKSHHPSQGHLLSKPNAPFGDKDSNSPATVEFQKAVSDTIASVKGFKPLPPGDEPDPSYLLVKGLAPEIDELYLYYVFAPFGAVQSVRVLKDEYGGCAGTAYVKMGFAEDAILAIQTLCGNALPDGSTLALRPFEPRLGVMGVFVKSKSTSSALKVSPTL